MSSFHVAMVRFSPYGRIYPVNCYFQVEPGDRVIVRFEKQGRRLQAAEVVETDFWRKPCANSVVCMESEAAEYGRGPDGVESPGDLRRFLKQQGWKYYQTNLVNWMDVYVLPGVENKFDEKELGVKLLADYLASPPDAPRHTVDVSMRIHFGTIIMGARIVPTRIGRSQDVFGRVGADIIVNGEIYFKREPRISEFKAADGGNIYHNAAVWAEGDLTLDLDSPPDTSLAEIRDAISDGSGGPYYLGDDVWL